MTAPHPVIFGLVQKNKRDRIRVALDEFKGHPLIDVRVFYEDDDGELKASPKGISIRPEHLPAVLVLMQEAERALRERGLIV